MTKKNNQVKHSPGGLKEVREIIFGESLTNLQIQINELKAENKNLKEELKTNLNQLNKNSSLLDDLASKHNGSDSEQKKLSKFVENLKTKLEAEIKELKLSKIGKNQIGQAFIEWGMKVKQDDNS